MDQRSLLFFPVHLVRSSLLPMYDLALFASWSYDCQTSEGTFTKTFPSALPPFPISARPLCSPAYSSNGFSRFPMNDLALLKSTNHGLPSSLFPMYVRMLFASDPASLSPDRLFSAKSSVARPFRTLPRPAMSFSALSSRPGLLGFVKGLSWVSGCRSTRLSGGSCTSQPLQRPRSAGVPA